MKEENYKIKYKIQINYHRLNDILLFICIQANICTNAHSKYYRIYLYLYLNFIYPIEHNEQFANYGV